jgi:hypothetical protein
MFSTAFCGYRDMYYNLTPQHDAGNVFAALR